MAALNEPTPPPSGEAEHGLSYWASLGVTPDMMFDASGQVKPGWTRTQDGYAYNGGYAKPGETPPPTTPPPNTPPPPTTGDPGLRISDLTRPFTGQLNAPPLVNLGGPAGIPYVPPTPQFTPPTFTPLTYESAANDPGYQFAVGQGREALEQSAAGRGVLNTGGTLKDLINYGQAAGATQFGNVWDRNVQAYNLAYRGAQDAFAPQMTGYQTQAAAGQRQSETDWTHAYDQWAKQYEIYRNQQNDVFNKQYQVGSA